MFIILLIISTLNTIRSCEEVRAEAGGSFSRGGGGIISINNGKNSEATPTPPMAEVRSEFGVGVGLVGRAGPEAE